MLIKIAAPGTSVSLSSLGQQSNTLSSSLSLATNSQPVQSKGITAGPVPISSKKAYAALGNEALSCFRNKDLASFIEGSASKGNDSAKAIMKMAVTLDQLRSSNLVPANNLQGPQDDLEALAARFNERPALSVMTRDTRHPSRYDEYQRLKKSVDTLLSKVDTAKVFEAVQLGLAQKSVVDGLRGGAERSWGQLDANSAKNVMANGNWSPAAGKALESQLKLAKAGGNSDALAEFISQTLKALDLSRPGREVAPEKPGNEPPKIRDHLHCCHGCGNGGVTQNANPVINVYPAGYTGVGGLDNLTDVVKQAVADQLGNFQIASPSEATKTTQTVSVQTDDQGLSDGGRDLSTAASSGVHSDDGVINSSGDDGQLHHVSDVGRSDSSSGPEFSNADDLLALGTFKIPRPLRGASSSNLASTPEPSPPGNNQPYPMPPVLRHNTMPSPLIEYEKQGDNFLSNDRSIAATTAALSTGQEKDVKYFLAEVNAGKVKVYLDNIFRAYVNHFNGDSNADEKLSGNIAMAIQLSPTADPEFTTLKKSIKEGVSIEEVKKTPVGQALFQAFPALERRISMLLARKNRVNDASPAAGEDRSKIITSVGGRTGIPGSYSATGNYDIQ